MIRNIRNKGVIFLLCLSFLLTGCGGGGGNTSTASTSAPPATSSATSTTTATEPEKDNIIDKVESFQGAAFLDPESEKKFEGLVDRVKTNLAHNGITIISDEQDASMQTFMDAYITDPSEVIEFPVVPSDGEASEGTATGNGSSAIGGITVPSTDDTAGGIAGGIPTTDTGATDTSATDTPAAGGISGNIGGTDTTSAPASEATPETEGTSETEGTTSGGLTLDDDPWTCEECEIKGIMEDKCPECGAERPEEEFVPTTKEEFDFDAWAKKAVSNTFAGKSLTFKNELPKNLGIVEEDYIEYYNKYFYPELIRRSLTTNATADLEATYGDNEEIGGTAVAKALATARDNGVSLKLTQMPKSVVESDLIANYKTLVYGLNNAWVHPQAAINVILYGKTADYIRANTILSGTTDFSKNIEKAIAAADYAEHEQHEDPEDPGDYIYPLIAKPWYPIAAVDTKATRWIEDKKHEKEKDYEFHPWYKEEWLRTGILDNMGARMSIDSMPTVTGWNITSGLKTDEILNKINETATEWGVNQTYGISKFGLANQYIYTPLTAAEQAAYGIDSDHAYLASSVTTADSSILSRLMNKVFTDCSSNPDRYKYLTEFLVTGGNAFTLGSWYMDFATESYTDDVLVIAEQYMIAEEARLEAEEKAKAEAEKAESGEATEPTESTEEEPELTEEEKAKQEEEAAIAAKLEEFANTTFTQTPEVSTLAQELGIIDKDVADPASITLPENIVVFLGKVIAADLTDSVKKLDIVKNEAYDIDFAFLMRVKNAGLEAVVAGLPLCEEGFYTLEIDYLKRVKELKLVENGITDIAEIDTIFEAYDEYEAYRNRKTRKYSKDAIAYATAQLDNETRIDENGNTALYNKFITEFRNKVTLKDGYTYITDKCIINEKTGKLVLGKAAEQQFIKDGDKIWEDINMIFNLDSSSYTSLVDEFARGNLTNICDYAISYNNGGITTTLGRGEVVDNLDWIMMTPIINGTVTESELRATLLNYVLYVGAFTGETYSRSIDIALSGLVNKTISGEYAFHIEYIDDMAIMCISKG